MNLLEAMAAFEGYGKAGSRNTRNNNPGNITWGEFARSQGATRIEEIPAGYTSKPRYAYFPEVSLGFDAMRALLKSKNYADLTLRQAITRWAPPIENDTEAYIKFICRKLEVTEDKLIAELL